MMAPSIALRPYQRDAADAVFAAYKSGIRRPGVSMATGAGKSILLAKIIEESQERTLVLAHRKEIVEQNAQKIGYFIDPHDIGIVMADRNEVEAPVVVASIQSLADNPRRIASLGDFGLVAIDECHHAAAPTWVTTLRRFGVGVGLNTKGLGLTATWDRSDGIGLDAVIDEIVYTIEIETLIIAGHLCDVQAVRILTDLDTQGNGARDWSDADVARRIANANIAGPLAQAVRDYAATRTSLVFAPDVAAAYLYRDALRQVHVTAEVVHGETPKRERESLLRDLRKGHLHAIVNCGIFTEGTDIPIVDCIVMGRPTKSRSLYQQMLGRGLRTYPGKDNCIVLDIVGSTEQHKLQTTASLFGLPLAAGAQSVPSVRKRLTQPDTVSDFDVNDFSIRTRKVDVIDRSRFAWSQVSIDADAFSLPAGEQGTVFIDGRDGDTWRVVQVDRNRYTTELAQGLDVGYAQGLAEQFVVNAGAVGLASSKAKWRTSTTIPATDRQLETLAKMRIRFQQPISKGEASNLIGAEIARRDFGRLR